MRTEIRSSAARTGAAIRSFLSALTLLSGAAVVGACLSAPRTAPPVGAARRVMASSRLRAPGIRVHGTSTSANWAGYAVTGSDFQDVVGTWQVPAVQPGDASHRNTYSALWVGIDGDNSRSVEQCGTEEDYINGHAEYSAWFEIYPSRFNVTLDPGTYPVAAGDFINAEVKYQGNSQFLLSLTSSQGWTATTTQAYGFAQRSSAEWIVEAPSTLRGPLPLANFETASFSGCKAVMGSAALAPLGSWPQNKIDQINMASRSRPLAQTDTLTGQDRDTFNVFWENYN